MIRGFLPFSRATIMFDVVAVALVGLVPLLLWSITLARRGRYRAHKRVQLGLGLTLLATVGLFEVDVQSTKLHMAGGWRALTLESPFHGAAIDRLLVVHLCFATTTAVLWILVTLHALTTFSNPPAPGPRSGIHKWLGWASTIGLCVTTLTGWTFYYMAFIATS